MPNVAHKMLANEQTLVQWIAEVHVREHFVGPMLVASLSIMLVFANVFPIITVILLILSMDAERRSKMNVNKIKTASNPPMSVNQ